MHWHPGNMIFGDDLDNKISPQMKAIRQSTNCYAYVMNNPLAFIDSMGAAAGDAFDSLNEAAKDFGQTTNPTSIQKDWEYGTYFYSWEEKKTYWFFGTRTKTVTRYSYTEPHTDEKRTSVSIAFEDAPIPDNVKWEATGHTHGPWKENAVINGIDWNPRFSVSDIENAKQRGVPSILIASNGAIYLYDPSKPTFDGQYVMISKPWKMPHDKNHPDLPKNHPADCNMCFEKCSDNQ